MTVGIDGLQEVFCLDCGDSLGFQTAEAPVQRELWPHTGCPATIARELGVSRPALDTALRCAAGAISGSYPDCEGTPEQQDLRASLAARLVLQRLAAFGFGLAVKPPPGH